MADIEKRRAAAAMHYNNAVRLTIKEFDVYDAFVAGARWQSMYDETEVGQSEGAERACVEEVIRRMREEGFDGEANEE